jgi:hypothetical protein
VVDQQDLRTAQCEQTKIIPHGESLQDLNTKPSIVTAIVNRDKGDAEVRQTVVGAVEAAGEAVGKDGIANMQVYQAR